MSLSDFFKAPENFVARERMLHMKAALEMKVAAAACGVQIQMTEPEIDNQGYDFTIASGYDHLYVQNKSTLSDSGVSSWQIHPLHLQVPILERDLAPQVDGQSVGGVEGAMGAVLLHLVSHQAAQEDRLEVRYYYFDIFYASAVASGLWTADDFEPDQAKAILLQIRDGERGQRIRLPLRAMLPITSPAALLAFRFGIPQPTNYVSIGRPPKPVSGTGGVSEGLKELWRANISLWSPPVSGESMPGVTSRKTTSKDT